MSRLCFPTKLNKTESPLAASIFNQEVRLTIAHLDHMFVPAVED